MILMVSWMTGRWPELSGILHENALLTTAVFAYQIVCVRLLGQEDVIMFLLPKSQQQKRLRWILWGKIQFNTMTCTFSEIYIPYPWRLNFSRFFLLFYLLKKTILLLQTSSSLLGHQWDTAREMQFHSKRTTRVVYVSGRKNKNNSICKNVIRFLEPTREYHLNTSSFCQ